MESNQAKSVFGVLLKGGALKLFYMAFSFLTGLMIAALSGTTLFGTISLLIANAAILQIITGLGTDSSIVWHGSAGGFTRGKLFSFTLLTALLQVGLFVGISIVVFSITGNLLLSWQPGFDFFWFELLYFASLVITEKYVSMMYGQHRAVPCNKVLLLSGFAVFMLVLFFYGGVIVDKAGMLKVFCLVSCIPAIALVVYYHFSSKEGLFAKFSGAEMSSFIQFSFIVFITNLIQFIAYRADYWLIDYFRNTEQVGVYSQATRFAQLLWVIPNILAGLLAPLIATHSFSKTKLLTIARVLSYVNLFLLLVIAAVSWFFYKYILGESFFAGYKSLFLMMPGYYFFCLNLLFAAWFSARRQLWINLAGSSICLSLILLADYLLIPSMGINGAALGNTIAYSIAGLFHLFIFMRSTQTSFADFFRFDKEDWRRILKLQS